MCREIKYLCPTACPSHIFVDFERASIDAFIENFPQQQLKDVFTQQSKDIFTQNVWRKIQEFGLQSRLGLTIPGSQTFII